MKTLIILVNVVLAGLLTTSVVSAFKSKPAPEFQVRRQAVRKKAAPVKKAAPAKKAAAKGKKTK